MRTMLSIVALAVALSACGPAPSYNPIPTPAMQAASAVPGVPTASSDGRIDGSDLAVGAAAGLAGYMLGKSAGKAQAPVIVQQPATVYRTVPQYRQPWYTPRPSTVTTTTTTTRATGVAPTRTYTSPSRSITVSRRR